MKLHHTTILAAAIAMSGAFTTAAKAEGYSVQDLGETPDRPTCLSRGEAALNRYKTQYGGGDVTVTDWVIYAWDFRPGNQDIVLMCPVVSGGVINGFMVAHGSDTQERRQFTVDEVRRNWDEGGSGAFGSPGSKGPSKK